MLLHYRLRGEFENNKITYTLMEWMLWRWTKIHIFTIVLSFTWWLLCTKFDDSNGALVGIGDGAFVDTESAPVVINEPNFKIRKLLISNNVERSIEKWYRIISTVVRLTEMYCQPRATRTNRASSSTIKAMVPTWVLSVA